MLIKKDEQKKMKIKFKFLMYSFFTRTKSAGDEIASQAKYFSTT